MDSKRRLTLITAGVTVIYTIVLIGWHVYTPAGNFSLQAPGADNRPEGSARKADDVVVGEFFMKYDENTGDAVSNLKGQWIGFRGANRDNIIKTSDHINVSQDFQEMWSFETGEGHAAPVIFKGKVYVMDYDETLMSDMLRCFSLETGKELWRRWYRLRIKRNHGFSRTIPAVGDGYVITIGPEGHVMCCDPDTGDMKWTLDMKKEFATEVPFWYTGQCPLVDNGMLVVAPAGEEVLLAGVDVKNGEIRWTTPNAVKYKMSHSSVMPMELGGKQTYVYVGVGGVCGVSAEDVDRGALLWSANKWQPSVVAPSPLRLSSNKIFLVAGYGTGGALLQVDRSGNKWIATVLEQYKSDKGLSAEQQTPILYNGMIISILPKDAGGNREKLVMYAPTDLHSPVWRSAADEKFGLGPFIVINQYLFAFNEGGELFVYEIEQRSMKLIKRQVVMEDGIDAWGPMAYADGMLIVRDAHHVKCIKVV
jgi:outer membrane protein assembly factor BamB